MVIPVQMAPISVKEYLNTVEKDMDPWLNLLVQISTSKTETMLKWPFLDSLLMMESLIVAIEIPFSALFTSILVADLKLKTIRSSQSLTSPKIILHWELILPHWKIHQNKKVQLQINLKLKTCQTLQMTTILEEKKMMTNFRKLNGFHNKNKIKIRFLFLKM